MLIRFLMGMFLALFSSYSFSQSPQYEYSYQNGSFDSGWTTPGGVISAWVAELNSKTSICSSGVRAGSPVGVYTTNGTALTASGAEGYYIVQTYSCTTGAAGNPSNRTISMARRAYIPPACQSGQSTSQTWHAGWGSSATQELPNEGTDPGQPSSYCNGSCLFPEVTDISCDRDVEPNANGNYEYQCTYTYRSNGAQCTTQTTPPEPGPEPTPGDPPGDPEDPDDPGTGDPEDPPDDGGGGPGDPDNPDDPEEGDPDDPGGGSGPGDGTCTPEQQAAGSCSGTCTPEQIASGTCDGGGGGTDPGTPTDPVKPVCGGPGLPSCAVKVDESAPYDSLTPVTKIGLEAKKGEDLISENSPYWGSVKTYIQKTAQELTGWTWTFQLPTGCVPYSLPAFGLSIDVCQFQSTIHDLMGFVWVLSTIAFLIRLFLWGID